MYADRYAPPEGLKPGSLAIAVAINAGLIAAMMFLSPTVGDKVRAKVLEVTNIAVPPPPEPIPPEPIPQPQDRAPAAARIDATPPIIAANTDFVIPTYPPLPPLPPTGTGGGGIATIDPPLPVPVLTGATVDPRYARDLQPDYPPSERRAAGEGLVVVRVLIGTDGRVIRIERVSAASEAFWRVTERQALNKWRFRPATRDGVAVEAWRQMSVRFDLQD